ncbi:hypothetical protein AMS68_000465 [Peltaster fructicola]|uniref:Fe2OG dioxygenase domain-containing protein n=1 Tax=Peltaster fructicola TaxID=286661 RepID=A0A6H0XJZ0_9PEZI|nr:hypothetical protein AMS68_000465 [Peltaster fructicola]
MAAESLGAVSQAVSVDNLEIPLIDFEAFLTGDASIKQETANAILSGFQRAGFIYLRNFGINSKAVAQAFAQSAKFFERPLAQKEELTWTTPEANRGYVRQGREKTSDCVDAADVDQQRALEGEDLKETMDIGREGDGFDNHWPDAFDDAGKVFKQEMLSFFDRCKELHMEIMRAVAVGLGIQETWFDSFCDAGDNTLRLLHYPAVSAEVFEKNKLQVRAGAHTDYGSITLLFQDMAGGLQVQSPTGSFVDATPIADTMVVNAGDLLARWSNETIKSTKHRVVEPPNRKLVDGIHPARYSIAYFCNPNFDRMIEAIREYTICPGPSSWLTQAAGTYDDVRVKKYEGINRSVYMCASWSKLTNPQWKVPRPAISRDILSRRGAHAGGLFPVITTELHEVSPCIEGHPHRSPPTARPQHKYTIGAELHTQLTYKEGLCGSFVGPLYEARRT